MLKKYNNGLKSRVEENLYILSGKKLILLLTQQMVRIFTSEYRKLITKC